MVFYTYKIKLKQTYSLVKCEEFLFFKNKFLVHLSKKKKKNKLKCIPIFYNISSVGFFFFHKNSNTFTKSKFLQNLIICF